MPAPVFAELAIAGKPSKVATTGKTFHADAVLKVGELTVELSNAVSAPILEMMKELIQSAI